MRRTLVKIEDVADYGNLSIAFWRAARGLRHRSDVVEFARDLDGVLARLGHDILVGEVAVGNFRRFVIRDPKVRVIHAPAFAERVLHHALIRQLEPSFERALVADTFACRVGKGSLAAVRRAQQHMRRFAWYVKIDVRRYFDSIDHAVLRRLVGRRIKGEAVLALCERIVGSYHTSPGRGLPIGALTSQHFANLYLGELDRFLATTLAVQGMVRYMDDVTWWCPDRDSAQAGLRRARAFLGDTLGLEVKASVQVQPSARGLSLCGFRVRQGSLLLSRRRRRRYAQARRRWESAWSRGHIDSDALQRGVNAALAITAHADARSWRREQLARVPPVDA